MALLSLRWDARRAWPVAVPHVHRGETLFPLVRSSFHRVLYHKAASLTCRSVRPRRAPPTSGEGSCPKTRLLLDSRVVDVPMSSNPIVVTLSSLKPFLFQWPSIRRCASRTMVEHKTPESDKSERFLLSFHGAALTSLWEVVESHAYPRARISGARLEPRGTAVPGFPARPRTLPGAAHTTSGGQGKQLHGVFAPSNGHVPQRRRMRPLLPHRLPDSL